jgi:FMN-dependent NADH-azoreductase
MKLLHIVASPRGTASNSLRVSQALIDALRARTPGLRVEVLDLFAERLPALVDPSHADSWLAVEALIARFLAADAYLVSTPMWNFGIPYALKYYIDCIVQPGYLFKLDERHVPVPLVHGRRMVCVTSRGNDYSPESPMRALDFQEPYLRTIFGFVGITDIEFITVGTTDVPALRDGALAAATARAQDVARAWPYVPRQAASTEVSTLPA